MIAFMWMPENRVALTYINGVLVNEYVMKGNRSLRLLNSGRMFYKIGRRSATNENFNGLIRDVMVFLHALEPNEVMTLYSKFCTV